MKYRTIVLSLLLAAAGCSERAAEPVGDEMAVVESPSPARVWKVEGAYDDVRQTLDDAITGRGMVISYVSHASDMLSRTADAVGQGGSQIYEQAEILLFCKADLSHQLVAANPENIVLCPYTIAIYSLPDAPGAVYLATPKPYANEPLFEPVQALLEEIIQEVVDW